MWHACFETDMIVGNLVDVLVEDGSLIVDCVVVDDGVIWAGIHIDGSRLVSWRESSLSPTEKPH